MVLGWPSLSLTTHRDILEVKNPRGPEVARLPAVFQTVPPSVHGETEAERGSDLSKDRKWTRSRPKICPQAS